MRKISILTIAVLLVVSMNVLAGTPQTICPICKGPINKSLHVDYHGKRVYFGCKGCPEKFMENPDKFMNEMKSEGIELEAAPVKSETGMHAKMKNDAKGHMKMDAKSHIQKMCICGSNHLNHSLFADVDGSRVYFCSDKCKDHFMMSPESNLKAMEKKGMKFEKAPAMQTTCPCGEKHLNHKVYTDVDGKRVYFCGDACKANFMKDPEGNLAKAEKKGMHFENTPKK